MLTINRREGETIVIDGNIRVTVVKAGRSRVELAIDAPRHIRVNRAEVQDQREAARPACLDCNGTGIMCRPPVTCDSCLGRGWLGGDPCPPT